MRCVRKTRLCDGPTSHAPAVLHDAPATSVLVTLSSLSSITAIIVMHLFCWTAIHDDEI